MVTMVMMMIMMIMRVMMMIDDTYVVRVLSNRIPHDRSSGWCWVAFFLKKGAGWFFRLFLGICIELIYIIFGILFVLLISHQF